MKGGKKTIATTSLAGCFGCHMSLLDVDEALERLAQRVEFRRTPLGDIKAITPCDIGLIEGGVCNAENVEVLRAFRANCEILVAVGACAINGGIPAMRNSHSLRDCLEEAYLRGPGLVDPQIPDDPELPLLLDRVHPIGEVVRVDAFLPGCPPSAEVILAALEQLLDGRPVQLEEGQIRYD
jgi:NAD-reducing hydrogenase small subunit